MKQAYFEIGQIVNTFGIKGILKVNSFTQDPLAFESFKTVLVEKNKKLVELEVEEAKLHKNQVLLKLKGINDINEAEKLKGCYIKLPRGKAKNLPKNTYFIADLIGMQVYTDEGNLLGKVDDIYNSGSADIYVVKDELGKQILLPGIKDVIKQVDVDNEKIIGITDDDWMPLSSLINVKNVNISNQEILKELTDNSNPILIKYYFK